MAVSVTRLNTCARRSFRQAQRHEDRVASAWAAAFIHLADEAVARFMAKARIASVGDEWSEPDIDELLDRLEAEGIFVDDTRDSLDAASLAVVRPFGDILDLEPMRKLEQRIREQLAQHVTQITETTRNDLRAVLQHAHDQHLPIDDAARLIRQTSIDASVYRSRLIARTELIGATNGASFGANQELGIATAKSWLTAGDEKVRPTHAEADGQTVPLNDPFSVGGTDMMYPGDPAGGPEEVCNCRCTLTYSTEAAASQGGDMPDAQTASVSRSDLLATLRDADADERKRVRQDAEQQLADRAVAHGQLRYVTLQTEAGGATGWRGMLCPLDTATDDGRLLEAGGIDWRELPLALMAQFETAQGHDGAQVAGSIEKVWQEQYASATYTGPAILAEGVFDNGPDAPPDAPGREAARLSGNGALRGVSVDLAVEEMELRTADNEPIAEDDDEAWLEAFFGNGLMVVTKGTIMGATLTPFPAFAEASVELVASLVHADALDLVAAAAAQTAAVVEPAPTVWTATGPPVEQLEVHVLQPRTELAHTAAPEVTLDQAQAYSHLVASGLVSRNDVRQWLGQEPVAGLDVLVLKNDELRAARASAVTAAAEARDREAAAAANATRQLEAIAAALVGREAGDTETRERLDRIMSILASPTTPPTRTLRVVRDPDGRAIAYEEVAV